MSATPVRVCVVTCIPSPYQVELFDAVAALGLVHLRVAYVSRDDKGRSWLPVPIAHEHVFIGDGRNSNVTALRWADEVDLLVVADYASVFSREAMARRCRAGRPWCFWGERPGARRLGILGTWYRKWRLALLHQHDVPIWGIGSWAVEAYRNEFGQARTYINVPYFSDLDRFRRAAIARLAEEGACRFLFSGALTRRKGVDLLADAFAQIAPAFPLAALTILGDGPLRHHLQRQLASWQHRVQFLGFQQWPDLPRAYAQTDILCVPSRYDGWGLVVPEGLAAGMPVIATDRTGAALDLVRPGANGWLVRAGSADSLGEAMRRAAGMSSTELLRQADAAQKSVAGHTLQAGAGLFVNAVEKTLENRCAPVA